MRTLASLIVVFAAAAPHVAALPGTPVRGAVAVAQAQATILRAASAAQAVAAADPAQVKRRGSLAVADME